MRLNSMRDLAATIRGRRHDLDLSQAELASSAGVSREWINELEAGKATVEFGLVIRVLDALGLGLDIVDRVEAPNQASANLDALLEEHRDR
jgi:HTH-type transcriptional regulator/antitoxin HipB